MRIRIRIYADKEPELFALYRACGPALTRKIFRRSVCAYIEGSSLGIDIPPFMQDTQNQTVTNPMFDISIPSEYDDALKVLPNRQISAFVKTLVRYYAFWALIDTFGVPHKESEIAKEEIKPAPVSNVVPMNSEKSQNKKKPAAEIPEPKKEDTDIMSLENSDVTSLAALFAGIKMG